MDNQTLTLDSLSSCVKYLKGLGYSTSSNTLVSRINSGMEYNGFILKYADDQTSTHSRAKLISITSVETGITVSYKSLREAENQTNI